MIDTGYCPLWQYITPYVTLASLTFYGLQKIPQQFILLFQPFVLIFVFRQCLCWLLSSLFGYSRRPSPVFSPQQPFNHIFIFQAKFFRYFPLTFSFCYHPLNLRQQFLHMRIAPFFHNMTPCVVFSYTGGLLSTVCFYWIGSDLLRAILRVSLFERFYARLKSDGINACYRLF